MKYLGTTLAALPLAHVHPLEKFEHMTVTLDDAVLTQLDALRSEAPCRSEIRMERGGARLFINGKGGISIFRRQFQSAPHGEELPGGWYALSASVDRT